MYNAEDRPVRWTQGSKVITMAFDRRGRRVSYREMNGATQVAHTLFLYNGYLCIQPLFSNSPWNVYKEFIWDPTEPIATRPLAFRQYVKTATFLMHDGNKNVTDVVTVGPVNTPVAHVDYAPFGAATLSGTRALDNPFRFSSEFVDDTLGLVYYNYRHYNPSDGRWIGRDVLGERSGENLYMFCLTRPIDRFDFLGRDVWIENTNKVKGLHRRVCVDVWVEDTNGKCCDKGKSYSKTKISYCISFGVYHNQSNPWDSFSGDGGMSDSDSSGDSSTSGDEAGPPGKSRFPEGFDGPNPDGDGMVYIDDRDPATKEVKRFSTNNDCQFDLAAYDYMKGLVGQCANYTLIGQSCRFFSEATYQELFRRYHEKKEKK